MSDQGGFDGRKPSDRRRAQDEQELQRQSTGAGARRGKRPRSGKPGGSTLTGRIRPRQTHARAAVQLTPEEKAARQEERARADEAWNNVFAAMVQPSAVHQASPGAKTPARAESSGPAAQRQAPAPAVQAKPTEEEILRRNAERDAAALLNAFEGIGTDEDVVYRVLAQPPEVVQTIQEIYEAKYNRLTGVGLVEDLRSEFDHVASHDDWSFVRGLLERAHLSVPGEHAHYERQDPAAAEAQRARIVAVNSVRVAVPGTRITYAYAHGAQQLHRPGMGFHYQWFLLHDPTTSQGHPARIEGPTGPQAEFTAEFPGNHKVICKVERRGQKGVVPAFYEYPLTVVPENRLAADALAQAPEGQDPGRALALLETYLGVLREAEQQPGSAPLDPKTAAAYEQQIAALKKRLASTEDAERIPIRAVHVERESARVSPLRAFVARVGQQGERQTWRLVDLTNPESRRLSGEYDGSGKDARTAILAALAAWNQRNRYPAGRIDLAIGPEAAGAPIQHGFQTDGQSFWGSVGEFFAQVGFWAGVGALAAGVVSAVAPVPGSRVVSTLVWTSILSSTVATGIQAAERHAEGMSTVRDDAMDALTIAGNILAGAWLRQARVLVNNQGGTKIGTGILIGQLGTDSVQGIVLGIEHLAQYERTLAIEDPEQRMQAMLELLRSAAMTATLVVVSAQGAKSDLDRLGKPGGQPGLHGLGGDEAAGTAAPTSGRTSAGRVEQGGQGVHADAARRKDAASSDAAAHPAQTPGAGRKASSPAGLPADLAALRERLTSPDAIAQFDRQYQRITRGKPAPTEVELGRFQRYLDSKGRTPAEIDAGLAAEWAKHHPKPKPPTGDAVDHLPDLRDLANRVLRRLEDAEAARPELTQGIERLRARVSDEVKILSRMERGLRPANKEGRYNVQGIRNNIESVEAELKAALRDPHTIDLSRDFKLGRQEIEIDRITHGGDQWVDVKNYELFGEHSSNMQALMKQARRALQLAEANPNPATGKIPEVVYEFAKGITPEARRILETVRVNGRGIRVIGDVKPLPHRARTSSPHRNGDGDKP